MVTLQDLSYFIVLEEVDLWVSGESFFEVYVERLVRSSLDLLEEALSWEPTVDSE